MRARLATLVLLSAIGLAAAVGALLEYTGASDVCPSTTVPGETQLPGTSPLPGAIPTAPEESGGCRELYASGEGEILGVHPSIAAPPYFAALLGLAVVYWWRRARAVLLALRALTLLGLLLVPYFVAVELRVGIICGLCTVMHASIIGCAIACWTLPSRPGPA